MELTVICILFHSAQISDWYSLYSTMENMCRPRASQMKRSLVNRGIDQAFYVDSTESKIEPFPYQK